MWCLLWEWLGAQGGNAISQNRIVRMAWGGRNGQASLCQRQEWKYRGLGGRGNGYGENVGSMHRVAWGSFLVVSHISLSGHCLQQNHCEEGQWQTSPLAESCRTVSSTVVWLSAVPEGASWWRAHTAMCLYSTAAAAQSFIWLQVKTTSALTIQHVQRRKALHLSPEEMVWPLQAASEMKKGWELAGLTASDWKIFLELSIRGGSPWWSGFSFLLNDAFFVFCSWPPNPCSSDPEPNLRADWGVASDLHGGAEKIIWRTQREVWYSRKWNSHF